VNDFHVSFTRLLWVVRIPQMNNFSSFVFEAVLRELASCIDKFSSVNTLVLLRTLPEPIVTWKPAEQWRSRDGRVGEQQVNALL